MSPGGAGILSIDDSTGEYLGVADDTVSLGANAQSLALDDTYIGTDSATSSSYIRIGVDRTGSYAGRIANGDDTVDFSFTTTGAVASMELTPSTQTALVGGKATVTLTLKDAAGNVTQPLLIDSVAMSADTAASTSPALFDADAATDNLAKGSADVSVTGIAAGTNTVTATAAGSIFGLTASATVTGSGTVSDDTVSGMAVTAPTTGVWNDPNSTFATSGAYAQVKAGTSNLTITVDDTSVNPAGETIRLAAWVTNGTVNGSAATSGAPLYIDVVTDSNKQATVDIALGGAAILAGQTLTVQQTTVGNVKIANTLIEVDQVVPTASESTITVSPNGSNVRQLGATTTVTVTVDDSLGDPVSGLAVLAYRGSGSADPANLLSQGVTNAAGQAQVTVTNASTAVNGTVEQYRFQVATVTTGTNVLAAPNTLAIRYTTSGAVTSMTVNPSTASPVNNTGSPAATTYTAISVPTSSTGGKIDTESTAVYTVATDKVTGTGGNYATFKVLTDPNNSVTVTAPEGVKVSSTAPTSATIWSSGSQSATIQGTDDDTLYVWATKTGTHDLTFESGGITTVAKVVVVNAANDAYNIALTPISQTVSAGAIGTAMLAVTDVFGNPVQTGTADDSGPVTVSASGEVLLAGFLTTNTFTTDATGMATVTFIAGNAAGTGTLAATPKANSTLAQWGTSFTPPTGAPAPVTSAAATVTVSTSPVEPTIAIVGERGIVRGKPGIIVDGQTTGFDEGAILRPWVKFPGETSYSLGVKVLLVDQDGEFTWQRRTGKKIYIIIKSEDESVRSNRIIIPVS